MQLGVPCVREKLYGKKLKTYNKTGIVVLLDQKHYFIPFSSYKRKHQYISNRQRDIVKLDNKTVLNINHMIPISISCHQKIVYDIIISDIEYKPYRQLLRQRLSSVNKKQEEITKKATWVYNVMCQKKNVLNVYEKQLKKRCLNFTEMEKYLATLV